jgi:hypothetical protein
LRKPWKTMNDPKTIGNVVGMICRIIKRHYTLRNIVSVGWLWGNTH